jgi:hypothetical protein
VELQLRIKYRSSSTLHNTHRLYYHILSTRLHFTLQADQASHLARITASPHTAHFHVQANTATTTITTQPPHTVTATMTAHSPLHSPSSHSERPKGEQILQPVSAYS